MRVERMQFVFSERRPCDSIRRTLADQLLGVLCQRLLPGTKERSGVGHGVFHQCRRAIRKYIAENRLPELQDLVARGDGKTAVNFLTTLTELVRSGQVAEETAYAVSEKSPGTAPGHARVSVPQPLPAADRLVWTNCPTILDLLKETGNAAGGSDLHLAADSPPLMRLNGGYDPGQPAGADQQHDP